MAALFLCLYIAAVMIRPHEFVSFFQGFPLPLTLELLTAVVWSLSRKRFDALQIKAVLLLNLSIAISWLTLSLTVGISNAFQFFANQALVLILIANIVDSVNKQRLVFMLIAISAAVMSIHGIYQLEAEDKIGWTGVKAMVRHDSGEDPVWQARYTGPFQDPNDMGMLLACVLPMIFYLWKTSKNIVMKLAWVGCALLIFEGIYIVNSRGTILAAVAPVLLFFALRYNLAKALVPIAVMVPVAIAVLPSRIFISNDESSQQRIEAWYQGYLMFKSNPVFGVGMNNFIEHHYKTAHNSWVLAYAELGLIGFYFWILVIFGSLHMAYHSMRLPKQPEAARVADEATLRDEVLIAATLFYSMVAAYVSAFFLSRTYSFLIYLLCGLCAASYFRMQAKYPDFPPRQIKGRLFILSIALIVMIALLVMFKS